MSVHTGKRRYRTLAAADTAASRIPFPVRAYKCPKCRGWHHTASEVPLKRVKERRFKTRRSERQR